MIGEIGGWISSHQLSLGTPQICVISEIGG